MKTRRQLLVPGLLILLLTTETAFAGPIMFRIQQKKMMEQQEKQLQGMTPEQYRQYVAYQEQQQGDHQPAAAAPPTYQQVVDQRNQAISKAILNAHNKSMTTPDLQSDSAGADNQPEQLALNTGTGPSAAAAASSAAAADNSSDVDLAEVWKKLDKKSTVWKALDDDQSKLLTVTEYISRFQNEGVKISAPPSHYVEMIDQAIGQNPQMLDRPFGELLQILAIIDYDFDNGMDKDNLAKQVLGEAGYEENKKRFAQAQQQQQQQQQQH